MIKFLFALVLLSSNTSPADPDPVQLSYKCKKESGNNASIIITANLDPGWHIYAQVQPAEALSIPTKIEFSPSPLISFIGSPIETGDKQFDNNASLSVKQYQYGHQVAFIQKIVLKAKVKTTVNGKIVYQACTGEKCLPPKTIAFQVPVQ